MQEMPIEITETAISEIKNIMTNKGIPKAYALRVGIKGGACSANFMLGFDQKKEEDLSYEYDKVQILIDKRHLMYLVGITVDFEETSEGIGFTFSKNSS